MSQRRVTLIGVRGVGRSLAFILFLLLPIVSGGKGFQQGRDAITFIFVGG